MNPEDEAFLTQVHRNLDKQAIGPESPFYVHLEELPGDVLGPGSGTAVGDLGTPFDARQHVLPHGVARVG